jgi:hypothetical protein
MKMRYSRLLIRILIVRLYGCLLQLYPPLFRAEFVAEIRDIFLKVILEAEERGVFWLLKTSLRELTALVISILRESGRELRSRKMIAMTQDNDPNPVNLPSSGNGYLQTAGGPNWIWVTRWALLTTAAFPAALIATAPLAALFLWLINFGGEVRLWPSINGNLLTSVCFIAAFALLMATAQWYLLRTVLPRAGWWIAATGGGYLLGGMVAWVSIVRIFAISWNLDWSRAPLFLTVGLIIGLMQWLYLRRFLPNALWIILIDELAAGSFLLSGQSFTSWFEVAGVLILPGIITGVGLWLLLRQSTSSLVRQEPMEVKGGKSRQFPRLARVGLGMAALVPLYFLCIWIYATSQLTLAKSNGIYATVEEAVIARNNQGWGGAEVIRLENVHASPSHADASQPHVWFGGATVYLDRIPQGWNRTQYSTGSYYIHVREGWVSVSEGAFPEFIGWVMKLYGLEGVTR